MKKPIYILFYVFLIVGCKNKPIEKPIYELTVDSLIKTTSVENFGDKNIDQYRIQISLKNNSFDTLKFWTMSCNWRTRLDFLTITN